MKKFLCILLCLAVIGGTTLTVGCVGGGGGGITGGGLTAILGVITIAAIITASGGGAGALAFAANVKSPVAQVRFAAASSKFIGKIKLNGKEVTDALTLTLSDDRSQLLLDTTLPEIDDGKHQISIDVYPVGSSKPPILRAIVTTSVSDGEPVSVNPAVDFNTTAKAMAYDSWYGSSTKFIDDFDPAVASITELASRIRTELLAGGAEIAPTATFEYSAGLIASATEMGQDTIIAGSRFNKDSSGVITDSQTGLKWKVASGFMNWYAASTWAQSVGGRAPSRDELKALNQPELQAAGKYTSLDALFGDATHVVWSSSESSDTHAWLFNYTIPQEETGDKGWDMHVSALAVVP